MSPAASASAIVGSAALVAAGARADRSTPSAAAYASRNASQYLPAVAASTAPSGSADAAATVGRPRRSGVAAALETGGSVFAATDPMIVPPMTAARMSAPPNPAILSVDIVWFPSVTIGRRPEPGRVDAHRLASVAVKNVCGAATPSSRLLDTAPARMPR